LYLVGMIIISMTTAWSNLPWKSSCA